MHDFGATRDPPVQLSTPNPIPRPIDRHPLEELNVTLVQAPTKNHRLLAWIDEMVELCEPDAVHWFDGSDAEYELLVRAARRRRHVRRARPRASGPGSYWARSDPSDVARVEDRTFICSEREIDAGPTNNWKDPAEMRATLDGLFRGSHARPHDVRGAVQHGPARLAALVHRRRDHRLAVRRGEHAHDDPRRRRPRSTCSAPTASSCRACTRSARRSQPGEADVAVAVQPRREVDRALPRDARDLVVRLGLRRQRAARQEVLRAAHRVGDRARRGLARRAHARSSSSRAPRAASRYIAAAFPSACGKTNLAMLIPTDPGLEGRDASATTSRG